MPPKKDNKAPKGFKAGLLVKDLVPPSIKQPFREGRQLKPVEPSTGFEYKTDIVQQKLPEEWPGDEAAASFNFEIDGGKNFTDPTKIELPPSFSQNSGMVIFWRRPKEFLKMADTTNEPETRKREGSTQSRFLTRRGTMVVDVPNAAYSMPAEDVYSTSTQKEETHLNLYLFQSTEREETKEEFDRRKKEKE